MDNIIYLIDNNIIFYFMAMVDIRHVR